MARENLVPFLERYYSDLGVLAADAAVEISCWANGGDVGDESLKSLLRSIDGLIQGDEPKIELSGNSYVMSHAISGRQNYEFWIGKGVEDLAMRTRLLAQELRDFKTLSRERQEVLIKFCINLTGELSGYENQFYRRLVA